MSSFVGNHVSWVFEKEVKKPEPFDKTQLTECTSDQLRIKIEYLERNILLLRSECEALELYSIKLQPERNNEIDTSWMPYDLNKEKRQPNIQKVIKNLRKMSISSMRSSKSVLSGSMYSIVKKAVNNQKLTINHMIFVLEKVLIILEIDFGKHCKSLSLANEKIKNEIESVQLEYSRTLQYIDSYKTQVLDPGCDLMTKRIPSDRYLNFIRKYLFTSDNIINEYRLRLVHITKDQKMLSDTLAEMQKIHQNTTDSDFTQAKVVHAQLIRKQTDMHALIREIEGIRRNVRMAYCTRMSKLVQFEQDLNLEKLDVEINNFRKKKLVTITKKGDDDDDIVFQRRTVPQNIINKQIDNYIKAKQYNVESDRRIKLLENKLERQKQTMQIYCQLLN